MQSKQKSKRNKIEDLLCPFTDVYLTQGSNQGNHLGGKATDLRGLARGVKYAYYAPCSCECYSINAKNGQSRWTSIDKVRLANGVIDYVSFIIAHDNSFDAFVGKKLEQGQKLANLGDLGYATGVHCHIEICTGYKARMIQNQNKYNNWTFATSVEFEDAFFMDNTNVLNWENNWKYIKDIEAEMENDEDMIVDYDKEVKEEESKEESSMVDKTEEQINKDNIVFKKNIFVAGTYAIKLLKDETIYITRKKQE